MRISIVIPNYNGEKLISKNLPKVIEALGSYKNSEIIISDDCSKDASVEAARKILEDSKIEYKVLTNSRNSGFSSNINRGITQAKGDIIVLLNTDVSPSKNFIDPLISDFESDDNLFGVGLMDKSVESGNVVLRGRGVASFKRGFVVHFRGEVDREDTFWISGGSSAIRRSMIEKIGAFDTLYDPFYWEDIDLSYRARKAGFKIKFNSESIVEHRHEEGSIKKHYKGNKVKTIAYRNQFTFVWKNITDNNFLISHILWLPYHFAKAALRMDAPFFIGFAYSILRLPSIIERRNNQKKLYKKKDFELFG